MIMNHWKVAGELVRPNSLANHSSPIQVWNMAFHSLLSATLYELVHIFKVDSRVDLSVDFN